VFLDEEPATLFRYPEQLAMFRADASRTDGAVEEILRYHSIGDSDALRVAVVDTEIGGQRIAAGEGAIPLVWSANRDDATFDRPDIFGIRRDVRGHLAFGYGIHRCLGLNLARIEMSSRCGHFSIECPPCVWRCSSMNYRFATTRRFLDSTFAS
jgi:pentalenic acid synthase